MKLAQLNYFKMVCKYNNITRAAAELSITQPSVSNAIKDLEEELGIKLFYRLSKGLSLTEEGSVFLKMTDDILIRLDTMVQEMRELGSQKKRVNIGIPPMVGTFLFPRLFQRFRAEHPEVNLSIVEHGSMHTRELVADGTLDTAIVAGVPQQGNEDTPFESIHIMDTESLFCTSKSHCLACRESVDMDMISKEPLVMFKEDSYHTTAIRKMFRARGMEPNVILYSSQLHTITELVANSVASSVLFKGVINYNEGVVGTPFEKPFISEIQLIWNKSRYLHGDIVKFIDFTRQYEPKQ